MSDPKSPLKYKRILLKLSGETLQDRESGLAIDHAATLRVAERIKTLVDFGAEVAIVVGGGNLFRGLSGAERGIDQSCGDHMGMLATIMNALALQNAMEQIGLETRVQTSISMARVAEPFILRKALRHLQKGRVVIFGGGTGNPFFSTDTAAALRASEIGANALLKATKVDGVYSADPEKDPNAERYATLTYRDALSRSLKVMDAAAFSLCMENHIPIVVFDFFESGTIEGVVQGQTIGTLVTE
ncbi:MAG: UMP kinase [Verrucomicrobia bacterium]|nr:UMP kinase [Verrucomicrobiota bacterium]